MKNLVLATRNPAKFERYSRLLAQFNGINIIPLNDFDINTKVKEPFSTAEENAEYKAKKYAELLKENVLAIDEALHVDFLSDNQQPGVHPRRIVDGVTEESDQTIFEYLKRKIGSIGREAGGNWHYALCIWSKEGEIFTCSADLKFVFDNSAESPSVKGYPLSSLCKNVKTGKLYAHMTPDERFEVDNEIFGDSLWIMISKFISVV